MNEHYEMCRALAKAYFAFKRNNSPADRFLFELAYAAYEASCKEYNINCLSQDDFLSQQTSMEVIFLPFR